jgi:hypothetical protein
MGDDPMKVRVDIMNRYVILALVAGAFALVSVAVMADRSRPLTSYQLQLRSQVESESGAPANGRDPATQPQAGLAAAASQPVGNGLRTNQPAAQVGGDHSHHVQAADVLSKPQVSGKLSNGCLIGYATPGEKCVTSRVPGSLLDVALPNQPAK